MGKLNHGGLVVAKDSSVGIRDPSPKHIEFHKLGSQDGYKAKTSRRESKNTSKPNKKPAFQQNLNTMELPEPNLP